MVDLPDEEPLEENHSQDSTGLRELVDVLKDEVAALRQQLEAKDGQLDAREREAQELHVLLQQAQAALPAPKENHQSSWWRFWER